MAARQMYHSINTADSDVLSAQTGARIGALLKNRPLQAGADLSLSKNFVIARRA